jgi:hypothetical protein
LKTFTPNSKDLLVLDVRFGFVFLTDTENKHHSSGNNDIAGNNDHSATQLAGEIVFEKE